MASEKSSASSASIGLGSVVDEMTEAIGTLDENTEDESAITESAYILQTKFLNPYFTNTTKFQRQYLCDHMASIGAAEVFTKNIGWLRGMEDSGFAEDAWPYIAKLYGSCHNFSGASQKFAEELGKAGIVSNLAEDLHIFMDTWEREKESMEILISSMGILYNMSKCSANRALFSEANAIGSLISYLNADNEAFKAYATFTLAYVVDKEENLRIVAAPSVISFVIKIFTVAIDDANRAVRLVLREDKLEIIYSAADLARGIERLAVNDTPNDSNKLKLVEGGVLPPLFKLLSVGDQEEQLWAVRAISQLAFHQSNRLKIHQIIPQLHEVKESENADIAAAASGALWQLREDETDQQRDSKFDASHGHGDKDSVEATHIGHVMLSYQWDKQETVRKIKARLQKSGYKVWMDIDQMGGSTLEAMAKAVENAAVVLVCLSRKYKESANCRRECEYAGTRGTAIIPLVMEDNYTADGWLGILAGASLRFNFDSKDFDTEMTGLMREIGERGKVRGAAVPVVTAVPEATALPEGAAVTPNLQRLKLQNWTREDVRTWIRENKLEGNLEKLEPDDLRFLCTIKKEDPAQFYNMIRYELGLTSISGTRKFCDALKKLEKNMPTFGRDNFNVSGPSSCCSLS